jgi:cytochrome d ubiquinol oxidase subunit II
VLIPLFGFFAVRWSCFFVQGAAKRDAWPFVITVQLFLAAFATLTVLLWPYIFPYSITMHRISRG